MKEQDTIYVDFNKVLECEGLTFMWRLLALIMKYAHGNGNVALKSNGEPISITELADEFNVTQPNASRAIKSLAYYGFIRIVQFKKRKKILLNPYIFEDGSKISEEVYNYFKGWSNGERTEA